MSKHRLFELTYYLLEHGQATAPELAKKLEVSVRTIYRDLDTLSRLGIPVYTEQGKGGGIRLMEEFVLDRSLITDEEKDYLLMALSQLSAIGMKEAEAILGRLGAMFQKQSSDWIEVDFSTWNQAVMNQDLFELLKQAIIRKQVISFRYFGKEASLQERAIEPLKLVFKSASWYVYGYCLTRQEFRFFKLTRMRQVQQTGRTYTRTLEHGRVLEPMKYKEETVLTTLRFAPELAYRVYDEFAELVQEGEYGYLTVEVPLVNQRSTMNYLLSFGDGLEVIAPEGMRQQMKEMMIRINSMYKT